MDSTKARDLTEIHGRPSHLVPASEKGKEWILAMVKGIYSDFYRYCPNLYYNNRLVYEETVNYLQGMQDPIRFFDRFDQNKSHEKNETSVNYDKRVLQVISKYFRSIMGRLGDVTLNTKIRPESAITMRYEEEFRNKMVFFMQLKKLISDNQIQGLSIEDFMQGQGIDVPDSMEELEIMLQETVPQQISRAVKKSLKWVNEINNIEQEMFEQDYNLTAFGVEAAKVVEDANGKPKYTGIHPKDLLVGYSKTEDARDVAEVGEFRMATINDIRAEDRDGQLSEKDYKEIEKHFLGRYSNETYYQTPMAYRGDTLYSKQRAFILDLYFYSYNRETTIFKPDQNGNVKAHSKGPNYYDNRESEYEQKYPGRRIYKTSNQTIYKASWVVGTEFIYNYGIYDGIAGTNPFTAPPLPITIMAPLMKNGRTVSIVEEMKIVADKANQYWKKMEECLGKARPPGVEIDVDSMMSAVAGMMKDGKAIYEIKEVLSMAIKENIVLVSRKGMDGVANGAEPFVEKWGGLGPDFSNYINGFQMCLNTLGQLSGFNGSAVGNPAPYEGKKVAELNDSSAEYSIKHLFRAKKTFYQNIMKRSCDLLMKNIRNGKLQEIRNAIGELSYNLIRDTEEGLYDLGIGVEFGPSPDEIQRIYELLQIAVKTPLAEGGISYPDAKQVLDCAKSGDMEEADALMRLYYNRNIKNAAKMKAQDVQSNAQVQQQSAAQTQQLEKDRMLFEAQLKMQITAFEEDQKRKTMYVSFGQDLEKTKLEGLIQNEHIKSQGEIDAIITSIEAKARETRLPTKKTTKAA